MEMENSLFYCQLRPILETDSVLTKQSTYSTTDPQTIQPYESHFLVVLYNTVAVYMNNVATCLEPTAGSFLPDLHPTGKQGVNHHLIHDTRPPTLDSYRFRITWEMNGASHIFGLYESHIWEWELPTPIEKEERKIVKYFANFKKSVM